MFLFRRQTRAAIASLGHICKHIRNIIRRSYSTYSSPAKESAYWNAAARARKALAASNANSLPESVPLVEYYAPRLLPVYRDQVHNVEVAKYPLSARTFCKWYRMVFKGPAYPTLRQGEKMLKHYSNRDQREIYRISRLLTDEEVFEKKIPWRPRYRNMWEHWLDVKGPDAAIIFA